MVSFLQIALQRPVFLSLHPTPSLYLILSHLYQLNTIPSPVSCRSLHDISQQCINKLSKNVTLHNFGYQTETLFINTEVSWNWQSFELMSIQNTCRCLSVRQQLHRNPILCPAGRPIVTRPYWPGRTTAGHSSDFASAFIAEWRGRSCLETLKFAQRWNPAYCPAGMGSSLGECCPTVRTAQSSASCRTEGSCKWTWPSWRCRRFFRLQHGELTSSERA